MGISSKPLFGRDPVSTLLRWRWIILAASSGIALTLELGEITKFDLEFDIETLLYVIVIPLVTWLLLTLLASGIAKRSQHARRAEQQRQFTESLHQCQEWNELTEFVTGYFGRFLAAERVTLLVYDHREARFDVAAAWAASGTLTLSSEQAARWNCNTCPFAKPPVAQLVPQCADGCGFPGKVSASEYCLQLSYEKLPVAVLRVKYARHKPLTPDQVGFIQDLSSETALALVLALAQVREQTLIQAEARLDERQQLAYELHDSLAQQLAFLHFGLAQLAMNEWPLESSVMRQDVLLYRDAAKDAYEQAREIVSNLRRWEATNLTEAVAHCIQHANRSTNLEISFTTHGQVASLPASTCRQIVGIVQECLNNVQKHARACHVQICLNWCSDDLELEVGDNGIGFEPQQSFDGHFGLVMIRERVHKLAGQLDIQSAPGQGSRVKIRIPVKRIPVSPEPSL